MEIDFSKLNGITPSGRDQPRPAAQSKAEDESKVAFAKLDIEKEDHNKTLEAYREYQSNIKKSEAMRSEILRGMKAGEPTEALLLKACEAIALMTDNPSFYSQAEEELVSVYGEGLLQPMPLKIELEGVTDRLERLEEAIRREELPQDEKKRIEEAIKAHRARQAAIQELMDKPNSGRGCTE